MTFTCSTLYEIGVNQNGVRMIFLCICPLELTRHQISYDSPKLCDATIWAQSTVTVYCDTIMYKSSHVHTNFTRAFWKTKLSALLTVSVSGRVVILKGAMTKSISPVMTILFLIFKMDGINILHRSASFALIIKVNVLQTYVECFSVTQM